MLKAIGQLTWPLLGGWLLLGEAAIGGIGGFTVLISSSFLFARPCVSYCRLVTL